MHKSYLEKRGLFSFIMDETSGQEFSKWDVRNRIDALIGAYKPVKCYCGSGLYIKPGHDFCSMICAVNSPQNIENMSKKQTLNSKTRIAKTRETFKNRYGVSWNNDIPRVRESKRQKNVKKREVSIRKGLVNLGLDPDLYTNIEHLISIRDKCSSLRELSEKFFNNAHVVYVQKHYAYFELDTYPKSSSVAENELDAWITSLGFETIRNNRTIIYPKEIDIFVPAKNLAIEFDGIYWHSTKKSDSAKTYHVVKSDMAVSSGVDLIHVFESELKHKPDIIKSIIYNKLGLSQKIHARKTVVKEIPVSHAREFFENTHLQGHANAKHYVGLFYNDELVSCMSVGKSRFSKECNLELIRLSSKLFVTVVGGFSKMLSYVRKNITVEPILTYCDRKISTGNTYAKFGRYVRTTEPGYSWHSFNGWFSRYQTQKHKLEKLMPRHYSPELTEKQIMEKAGYYQLYDCGHKVYILE